MIGTSTFDYLFIQGCIYSLHYLAPLSITYCLIALLINTLDVGFRLRLPLVLEVWAVFEAAFYIFVYRRYLTTLQLEAHHPPPPSRAERKLLFTKCNATIKDPEEYFRMWFLGSSLDNVKRDNIKEFFLWAFFNRGGTPGEDNEELEEYVKATERMLGWEFPEGRGNATCLRLTLDEVRMLHRSLCWYFCVSFVDLLTSIKMRYFGFLLHRTPLARFLTLFPFRHNSLLSKHRSPVKHLSYWLHPHTSKTKRPILFIHGIGIGLYPYVDFLAELNASDDPHDQVGVIAIEIMPISFRITHPMLAKDEMCSEIHEIIKHHGWTDFVLVSHSYGTAISTHLLKYKPISGQIASVVLMDPITFLLHLPDVAYNFTRREPKEANELQLYYFASMDMGVSHALSRCFFWSENILWKEDVGKRPFTVVLAERDLIVNTYAVGNYLTSSNTGVTQAAGSLLHDCQSNGNAHHGMNGHFHGNKNGHTEYESALVKHEGVEVKEKEHFDDWKNRKWLGKGMDLIWNNGIDHAQVFDTPRSRRPVQAAIASYCDIAKPLN